MRSYVLPFIVALLAGCDPATNNVSIQASTTAPTDEEAVCEAVFGTFLSAPNQGKEWSFIAWPPNADPPPELLTALQAKYQAIAPFSKMSFEGYPRHRDEGGRGVLLQIDRIEWINTTHVKVEAAHIIGNLGGTGWSITLEKASNTWRVVKREATWVS